MSTHCPDCGHSFNISHATEAQSRIADLETQVRLLNSKASSYLDRLGDYEDEVQSLRAQCAKLQKEREGSISVAPLQTSPVSKENASLPPPPPIPEKDTVPQGQVNRQSLSRLSSFTSYLPGRRKEEAPTVPLNTGLHQSTPNLGTPTTEYLKASSPPPFATDPGRQGQSLTLVGLQTSLETERSLRQQAETNLAQSQTELEELTAQLFGQANEMVATERKARAKLEERVKLLETRDGEKRRRLERLETAVQRIERVRRMVVEHEKEMGDDAYVAVEVPQRRDTQKIISMRHMRRTRSRSRRGDGYGSSVVERARPEVLSEDEEEDLQDYDDLEDSNYEFDVQLKVWRRSRANIWRTPSFG